MEKTIKLSQKEIRSIKKKVASILCIVLPDDIDSFEFDGEEKAIFDGICTQILRQKEQAVLDREFADKCMEMFGKDPTEIKMILKKYNEQTSSLFASTPATHLIENDIKTCAKCGLEISEDEVSWCEKRPEKYGGKHYCRICQRDF